MKDPPRVELLGACHRPAVRGHNDAVTDVSYEGWYTDPYRRHQARWMSQGTPTPLVKDAGIEGHDPVGDEPFEVTPVRFGAEGPPSKGRNWGLWLVVVGVLAILGGFYLIQTPTL